MSRSSVVRDVTSAPPPFHQSQFGFVLVYGFSINHTTSSSSHHVFAVTFSSISSTGILLLCQHHNCDELSTPSLASSGELETKDLTTTTVNSTAHLTVSQTKTSAISTTTTHTTRLHRITDETLIDVTTSIDSLCLARSDDDDDNYSINSIGGDVIVTIILIRADNATEIIKFIVNHINAIDLLVHNVTIGELMCGTVAPLLLIVG